MDIRGLGAAGLALIGLLADPSSARAEERSDLLSFGLGQFDTIFVDPEVGYFDINPNKPHDQAVDFRVEYRFGTSLLSAIEPYASLRPFVGAEITSDGAAYGLGGILIDVPLGSFVFTPSVGAGFYTNGDGKDMGANFEFRSQIELAYEFENKSRFTLGYSHVSNADIADTNPGSNVFSLYYHIPSDWIFGKK